MKRTDRMRVVGVALAASIATWAAPALAADALTIADIAPKNSALIVGADDFTAMRAAFDRTGMKDIMDDPSVKAWFKDATKEATEKLADLLETIDAKMEDLSAPTGAAGFAVWMQEQAEPTDPPFGFIAMGDFGENAQKMHDTLVAAFEKGEEDKKLTMKSEDFADTEIYTLTQIEPEKKKPDNDADKDADNQNDDDWQDWEDWENQDAGAPAPRIQTVYYAHAGSRLMVSSVRTDLENAIDRADGKKLESVRDSEDFHTARADIGTHDAYAVLLTKPLLDVAAAEAKKAADESGDAGPAVLPWLDALGISDVQALSAGVKFDTDDAMMESKYAVLAPKFRGLLSLFDVEPSSFAPPPFVPADAATYTMIQVKLADVMNVLQEVIQGLPADQAQQAGALLPMIQGFAGPMLNAMGSKVYMSQGYAQPYGPDSKKTLVAISASNTDALSAAMGQNAAQMGLVSRDFQGNQIWSMPPDAPIASAMGTVPDIAIAIGFGNMFIGPEAVVENALRLAAQGGKEGALTLANEDSFQNATHFVAPKGFSFSYTNLHRTLEYAKWFVGHYDEIMKAQMEKMLGNVDDPQIKKMMQDNQPEKPEWLKNLPDLDIIAKHVGDSVTEFQRSDDGMRGRTLWLRPSNK